MTALTIQQPGVRNRLRAFHVVSPIAIVGICLATIGMISALDIWFAVANESIMHVEQNPVCLALMKMDPGGFKFFIAGKAFGTSMVICSLVLLHRKNYCHAMKVTYSVTAFQVGLLTYLTLSDPTMYNLPNFSLLFTDTPESIWRIE
jgi:hypothetical protein